MDLHVIPRPDDEKSSGQIAELLKIAGYEAVGLTIPTGLMKERVIQLRRIFEQNGIDTVLRVDLASTSREDLLRLLRRFRSQFDVVAVKCLNQRVAAVACRDRRVDVVFFDPHNQRVRFNHSFANLLRGVLEFNVMSTLFREERRDIFSRMVKEVAVASDCNVRLVLSSGCSEPLMVRTPRQIAALGSAMGVSEEKAIGGVSEVPWSMIVRNLQKRAREYVEEGVRVILPRARLL